MVRSLVEVIIIYPGVYAAVSESLVLMATEQLQVVTVRPWLQYCMRLPKEPAYPQKCPATDQK